MGLLDWLIGGKKRAESSSRTAPPPPSLEPIIPTTPVITPKRGDARACKVEVDDQAMANLGKRYIAFDVETTGLSADSDRIVELGAVLFVGEEPVETFSSLVNPGVPMPASASRVNHITDDMLASAPGERQAYEGLVAFLGDALEGQTAIVAHNARFDASFLAKTLSRLGYDADIRYVDTLSLSRSLLKGLEDYKQSTIARHFGIANEAEHRASSDARTCGLVLSRLLGVKREEAEERRAALAKSRPSDEELEVCAFIQDRISKGGGDTSWLGFYKNSGRYVDVTFLYSVVKFKFARGGNYMIVEKPAAKGLDLVVEPCTKTEGDPEYLRVYFDNPFDLEPLTKYILKKHREAVRYAREYCRYNRGYAKEIEQSASLANRLTDEDVAHLLENAKSRLASREGEVSSGSPQAQKGEPTAAVGAAATTDSLEGLGLPVSCGRRILEDNGITSLGQLVGVSRSELLSMRGLGQTKADNLVSFLRERGIMTGSDDLPLLRTDYETWEKKQGIR